MQPESNFVILDPLNLQNNTTKNSYLTKDILLKFQSAFNNLKNHKRSAFISADPHSSPASSSGLTDLCVTEEEVSKSTEQLQR